MATTVQGISAPLPQSHPSPTKVSPREFSILSLREEPGSQTVVEPSSFTVFPSFCSILAHACMRFWRAGASFCFCVYRGRKSVQEPSELSYSLLRKRTTHRVFFLFFLFFFSCGLLGWFFFFNWSIVDLQRCVSFSCAAKWFSYTYIYLPLFFFRFFSIVGYYKILNEVPCAIQ